MIELKKEINELRERQAPAQAVSAEFEQRELSADG